ncbi:DUF1127 domain-containing protein [Acidisoma sp. L85]|uniref:DUF1127 domain-containing protein n=2 Tax=unclassified Acidisoma TaxID=2634065 RepID=UPI00131D2776|nr:DUF1127 domain-containing protein [Acidisoma sp. L85]
MLLFVFMKIHSNATHSSPITQQAGLAARVRPLRLFQSLWHAVLRARRISRERDELTAMSAHMLADIGASPNDAQMEGARSFWDTREQFDPSQLPRG